MWFGGVVSRVGEMVVEVLGCLVGAFGTCGVLGQRRRLKCGLGDCAAGARCEKTLRGVCSWMCIEGELLSGPRLELRRGFGILFVDVEVWWGERTEGWVKYMRVAMGKSLWYSLFSVVGRRGCKGDVLRDVRRRYV
jgi:hypothetical protein